MPEFMIGGSRGVGNGHPCFIVAEACDNHMGSINTAREMALRAKLAGADAVKYQHHLPDEEMLPDTPTSSNMTEPLYDFLKKNALTLDQHKMLKAYCDEIGLRYMCTPFSYAAAKELVEERLLDVIKIGSGEMTDIPSLIRMAEFDLPMIVSTGMCTFDEIQETYDALVAQNTKLCLMNCVSEYPPAYKDINFNVIGRMREQFPRAVIGHSDHAPTLYTSFAAVAVGAKVVEKHVILDKMTPGPDQSVSIDFNELADLVRGLRIIEAASGSERKVHDREKEIRTWAFRSIVSCRSISTGEVITQDMVWSKRPGTGILSREMPNVIGKRVVRNIAANTMLRWEDIA
jgi:N,N'-diacetyllegionaminate synthase